MANVVIDILAEFTGKKAFKQAESATAGLEKGVKRLAKQFASVFAAQKLLQYGKASVKAFAADDNAARSLAKTLQNLGINTAHAGDQLNGYISRLEKQTGVLDDELRPAMDRLLRATGNVAKSQELLGLALDISSGTGKDLTAVSQGLQKAFLGNNQSLGRLGVGLSKAELKSSSFLEIQKRLTVLFAGQAKDAAESFQGSLNKLTVASNNAKEAIGKGLIESLQILAGTGGGGVNGAVDVIGKMANGIAEGTKNIAYMIKQFEALKPVIIAIGALLLIYFAPVTAAVAALTFLIAKGGANLKKSAYARGEYAGGTVRQGMSISGQTENALGRKQRLDENKIIKTGIDLKKIDNGIIKDKIQMTAGEKALAELKKIFDIEGIELQAALNGTITKEEKARLDALKAIHDSDDALALQALSALNAAGATDIFAAAARTAALKLQTSYSAGLESFKQSEINSLTQGPMPTSPTAVPPSIAQGAPSVPISPLQSFRQNEAQYASSNSGVSIQINPAVAGLIDVIQNQSASGISPTVSRVNSSYIA